MQTDYSEQDTEQARRAERSSAGVQTENLTTHPSSYAGPATIAPSNRTNNMGALALIAVGIFMLMGRALSQSGTTTAGMILLTIGSCFLFFAFWRRIYGLLIPGCILAGLSIGISFVGLAGGVSVLWGLSLGFLGILLIGRKMFNEYHPWPAIPAVILFAVGLIVAIANAPVFLTGGLIWLPLLLIGAGLYLGWGKNNR